MACLLTNTHVVGRRTGVPLIGASAPPDFLQGTLVMSVTSFSSAQPFSMLGIGMSISSLRAVLPCGSPVGRMTLFRLRAFLLGAKIFCSVQSLHRLSPSWLASM
jgi:hypothetical protein